MQTALAQLGLADGADREAVIRAYRRLARATHPDLSDAPDAEARFAVLEAAYRRALVGTPDTTLGERAAVRAVRVRVPDGPTPRRAAAGAGRRSTVIGAATVIGDVTVVDPPIVAGPVHVVPPPIRPGARPFRTEG